MIAVNTSIIFVKRVMIIPCCFLYDIIRIISNVCTDLKDPIGNGRSNG